MSDEQPGDGVRIERTFDAPLSLVWRMWTEPEHFAAWYGPEAGSVSEMTLDVRVGGHRRLCMQVGTGDTVRRMWFGGEFLEVVEHQRLVYTDSMTDEHGRVLSPAALGLPPGHPATTEVHVDMVDLGGSRTRVVMTHVGVPEGSPGASGWNTAFDSLTTRLEAVRGS
jgi:uncharacterized protein YndB with AHSA1/START domain